MRPISFPRAIRIAASSFSRRLCDSTRHRLVSHSLGISRLQQDERRGEVRAHARAHAHAARERIHRISRLRTVFPPVVHHRAYYDTIFNRTLTLERRETPAVKLSNQLKRRCIRITRRSMMYGEFRVRLKKKKLETTK